MKKVLIIGAGDQPKIVIDALQCSEKADIIGMIDVLGKKENIGKKILECPVLDVIDNLEKYLDNECIIAVGDPDKRSEIAGKINSVKFMTVIHPRAYVSKTAKIGEGSMISVFSAINPNTIVGKHCIINTAATIDHDCRIGDFTNISPGVSIAGNVTVGERTLIGVGAKVKDEVSIGSDCVIGAGSVVVDNIPDNSIAMGIPAKITGNKK